MTIHFSYNKGQVLQALRYHFISRPEIRVMIIVVNAFALLSAALFYFKKITPLAHLVSSTLWFVLMITIWFLLPLTVYKSFSHSSSSLLQPVQRVAANSMAVACKKYLRRFIKEFLDEGRRSGSKYIEYVWMKIKKFSCR
jgi:urea transporter